MHVMAAYIFSCRSDRALKLHLSTTTTTTTTTTTIPLHPPFFELPSFKTYHTQPSTMPSSDGGGCSGGSPLTSLINTVTGFSPPTQIKTTTQVASLQEGFRTPRAGAQDEDIVSQKSNLVSRTSNNIIIGHDRLHE